MNNFFNALTTKDLVTENGMPTHSTSGSFIVDLFYRMAATRSGMGAMRSRPQMTKEIVRLFNAAWAENPEITLKCLFYLRDIRGGQGERQAFRYLFRKVCMEHPDTALRNLSNIPYYGRWDDVFVTFETPVESYAIDFILSALKRGDKLCAKWMPRENKSLRLIAKKLMKAWKLSPRNYRKLLAGNTEVVENLMCKNKWEEIIYSKVPTRAMYKYRRAFPKHDPVRFLEFIESLEKGETKVNATAIFPHEIVARFITNLRYDQTLDLTEMRLLNQMWENLPDFIGPGSFITVNDVSGSMDGDPMNVSIGLGMYCSQRNKGIFKDGFITFSSEPTLQYLKGTLEQKATQLLKSKWQMNTDLEAVFDLILEKAVQSHLKNEDMPQLIVIISDMQFDAACKYKVDRGRNSWSYSRNNKYLPDHDIVWNPSVMEMIENKYKNAGYSVPRVVFWNVRNSEGIPGKSDQQGVALVSGYSPSIMQYLLKGDLDNFTPIQIVKDIVSSSRYERVVL